MPSRKRTILERLFDAQVFQAGLPTPETEYKFHPERNWRFDDAWPWNGKLAVEIEGGVWSGGRHVRGAGFEADCEKYNEAALMGWTVLRFTGAMVQDGRAIEMVRRWFGAL